MKTASEARIDLSALAHNVKHVRELIGKRKILAMVKANAYGHGLISVANALDGVDALGIATIEEAVLLRESGIKNAIVVMTGFANREELMLCVKHNITPVIHHVSQLDCLEEGALKSALAVWLKLDTGMHRLGFSPSAFRAAYDRLKSHPKVSDIVLMSHLADADNPDVTFTYAQIQAFQSLVEPYSNAKSLSNSAAILAFKEHLFDWVRPGIMLYGVSPFSDSSGVQYHLTPVMELCSKIIAIKQVQKGESVGYGCTWTADADMPIAVVNIGYGDGYPRHAKNGTPVLVNGVECSLVGRVSMDMITVDLRPVNNANVGDIVTLWGKDLPVERVAAYCDTIAYELLTKVTSRVSRKLSS